MADASDRANLSTPGGQTETENHGPSPSRAASGERFPRELRLRKKIEFDRVYAARRHASDGLLVVNAVPNDLPYSRLGLAVGKPVGNAVVRGRWKRRLRDAFRRHRGELPSGFDYVVRPRPGVEADSDLIVRSLVALTRRLARPRRENRG